MLPAASALLLAPDAAAQGSPCAPVRTARYEVTFDALWSEATHPTDFPPSAHFSGLAVAMGQFDSGGFFVAQAPNIPNPFLGRVFFQAALRNTCPDPCMSNVVEAEVE